MSKIDFLTAKVKESRKLPDNFFDYLVGPPVSAFFSPQDHAYLKQLVLQNRNDIKIKWINAVMKSKGFSRLSGGTNRMVYRFLDDPSFVLKIAIDRVGMNDNLAEFKNQQYLKPYVCKIFDTTSDGLMATIERVYPITSKEEFTEVQEEVFYLIVTKIIGKTVAEDIGKNYFRNYGIRPGFGVVLLDYPYIYPLDGSKLFCTHVDPNTGARCTGLIDYDDGFNHLFCRKCGTRYLAVDLEDKNPSNDIIMTRGGNYPMKIKVVMSDGTVKESIRSSNVIVPQRSYENRNRTLKVRVVNQEVSSKSPLERSIDMIRIAKPTATEERTVKVQLNDTVKSESTVKVEAFSELDSDPIRNSSVTDTEEKVEKINQVEDTNKVEEIVMKEEPAIIGGATTPDIIPTTEPEPDPVPESLSKYPAKKNSSKKPATKKAGTAKKAGAAKTASGVKSKFIPSPDTADK